MRRRRPHGLSGLLRRDADGAGTWQVNGMAAPSLAGCLDVYFEASAVTNALPVHRLRLDVGDRSAAPAAFVRAVEPEVERLEQFYVRADGHREGPCFDYTAPVFDVSCRLVYDRSGLVLDYPGLAVRTA